MAGTVKAGTGRRAGLTLFAMGIAFLLPVAFSPSVHAVFWAPKAALIPLIAAVGLPRLLLLARSPSPARAAARAALTFLGVATLSTLLADNHTTAVFGLYNWGTGLIFVVALAGAWAIGVSLDESGRGDVTKALLAGVLVNVVFALLEMVGDLSSFELARYDGRSIGLMGNPVHLGAIAAAGLALAIPWDGRRLWPWLAIVTALAAAVEVSGSRAALIAMVVVMVVAFRSRWIESGRPSGSDRPQNRLSRRRRRAMVLCVLLGLGAGSALTHWGGGVSVSQRVAEANGGGGLTPRLSMWWATRHAVADHPLVGSGPGTYREATSRYRTVSVARAFGADNYFTDAHNLVVEYATTTGILGLTAFLAWLALAWRRTAGPLQRFAMALVLAGLVEPQWLGTTPLALLALGMARPVGASRIGALRERRQALSSRLSIRLFTAGLILASCLAGSLFLLGEFHLDQASLDFDRFHADRSLALLPRWSRPAAIRGRIETFEGRAEQDRAKLAQARRWQMEAIRRDPSDPFSWLVLGDAAAGYGRPEEAERAYRQVLTLNPMSTRACNGLADLAYDAGRSDDAAGWLRRSLAINPNQTGVRRALDRISAAGT
ncbi:MAG: O-antigen ligase family protein [Acidimicrobiales bacterium]